MGGSSAAYACFAYVIFIECLWSALPHNLRLRARGKSSSIQFCQIDTEVCPPFFFLGVLFHIKFVASRHICFKTGFVCSNLRPSAEASRRDVFTLRCSFSSAWEAVEMGGSF